MGAFDDLIPAQTAPQSSGAFADLIPQSQPQGGNFINALSSGIPFGDELSALGAAGVGKILPESMGGLPSGTDFGDAYSGIRDNILSDTEAFADRNPKTALAGELAGAGLTGAGIAGRVLGAVPQAASKIQKGAALVGAGALDGGLTGAGSGEGFDRVENALEGAALGGVLAPVAGAGVSALTKRAAKKKASEAVEKSIPTTSEIKSGASKLYNELDQAGVTLKQSVGDDVSKAAIKQANKFSFNKKLQPGSAVVLKEAQKLAGKEATWSELHNLRKIASNARSTASQNKPDKKLIGNILNEIDDRIAQIKPEDATEGSAFGLGRKFKQANSEWKKSIKSEMIDDALSKAKNQASGEENGIRIAFRKILNSDRKSAAFSKDELASMRKVEQGTFAGNTAKLLGRFGFNEGKATSMLGASIGIGGGAVVGGPVGAILAPVAGQAFKKAAQSATKNNAKLASELVRAGKNPKSIIDAYVRSGGRNTKELSGLLIDTDLEKIQSIVSKANGPKRRLLNDTISLITDNLVKPSGEE